MGYNTRFEGGFRITPPLSEADRDFLTRFSVTRHMKRCTEPPPAGVGDGHGVEGEWYMPLEGGDDVDGFNSPVHGYDQVAEHNGSASGGVDDPTVIDPNSPPSPQPGLWCQWVPNEDGTALVWDEGEKFYHYVEWLLYLIDNYFTPCGYVLDGEVRWRGDDNRDFGVIEVKGNRVQQKPRTK